MSELRTWEALLNLDRLWTVFYSVAWQGLRSRRQGDGEADFAIVHPHYGIVVLEVKGGDITIEDGRWYTTPHGRTSRSPIKNPFTQAVDSKHALLRKLRELTLNMPSVCHGVVLTGSQVTGDIALYGPRAITLDELDLLDIEPALMRVFAHWQARAALTSADIQSLTQLLAPTLSVHSGLRTQIGTSERALLALTEQQVRAINGLRRSRRTLVFGGPGTGKTVLAAHRARVLASQGGRVLLTCFNRPLADKLRDEMSDTDVVVGTFHSQCLRMAHQASVPVPPTLSDDWWEREAADVMMRAAAASAVAFDAIVIDEAQDFAPDWIAALELLLDNPNEGIINVFADEHQSVYRAGGAPLQGAAEYVLDVNCRSTIPIVRRVEATLKTSMTALGSDGPPPLFIRADDSNSGAAEVQQLVARLVDDEGLNPASITILCSEVAQVDRLLNLSAGGASLVRPGQQGVPVETIQRFKGLESETAIVWLSHGPDERHVRVLAYVGFSRARSMLFVVGTKALKKSVHWSG